MAGSKNLTIYIPSTGVLLTDFPFLITGAHMTQTFWDSVLATGADIILYDSADTKLKRELASIDTTNKTMELHVKCTRSATAPTLLRLNYCDPAGAETNDTDTWVNTYKMVHHMNDNPDTSTIQDSTSNNNDGAKVGAATPTEAAGAFSGDKAQDYVDNEYITVTNAASIQDIFDGGGTVEAVVYPDSAGQSGAGRIFSKGNVNGWELLQYDELGGYYKLRFAVVFDDTAGRWDTTSRIVSISSFQHIVISYDADNVANNPTFYINGTEYTVGAGLTESSTPVGTRLSDAGVSVMIGDRLSHSRSFDGLICDGRFNSDALSADWIAAEYQNLLNNAATYHVVTPNVPRITRIMLAMHG